jgi:hypothetical protein
MDHRGPEGHQGPVEGHADLRERLSARCPGPDRPGSWPTFTRSPRHELPADSYRHRRQLSPVEVTQAVLEHIDLGASPVRHLPAAPEHALAQARASEARWREGAPLGPLDGVPVTIKENIATQGDPVPLGTAATQLVPRARRRAACGAPARSGRGAGLQDHHARLRHAVVGPVELSRAGRNPWDLSKTRAAPAPAVRRCGRRRLRPAAHRHRHRRLAAPAGGLVRHLQPQAQPGPHSDRPALHRARGRPHDAQRGRRGR